MPMRSQKWIIFLVGIGITLLIDRLAKIWITDNLNLGETMEILPALSPYLQITRTFNTGVAFGLGSGGSGIFMILAILIVTGLVVYYARTPNDERLQQIALSLIIGGALGNIIDRFLYQHVIDFVHVYIPGLVSNVSNFADHFIVVGVGLMLIETMLEERRIRQEAAVTDVAVSDGQAPSSPPSGSKS